MLIEDDVKFDYSDVLIRPKRSTLTSRFDVEMERTYTFYHSQKEWTGVPIIASNMDTTGTFEMHWALSRHKMVTCIARHYNKLDSDWSRYVMDEQYEHSCVMSGISKEELTELVHIAKMFPVSFVGLDVANGYTKNFVDAVSHVRKELPDATIIAGNVVTGDMTAELIMAGADIVKAFAGGADFVMIGGMLAGHDECDGELVFDDDVEEPVGMKFYGMASNTAMERHGHPNREYRGEEGKTVTVPYRGAVKYTVLDILGGVRSACTYVGAKRLKDLTKCATFVKVNNTHNRIYE